MTRLLLAFALLVGAVDAEVALQPVPDKTVVLTFDDAVKSHRTFVGPLLKEYGFGGTFFVTALWMSDTENFMTWEEIGELHQMGFEIGNHSWSHSNFGSPKVAAQLESQLSLVEQELEKVGVPKPTAFAWCGNAFSPDATDVLRRLGYVFARRGMQPEVAYGKIAPGPLYEPATHHPLLLPSAGDAYPDWTLENFKAVVDRAREGKIAIVQFHGVPDVAHPWVHTPPERFREYMDYLKANAFNVIAMRDLSRYVDPSQTPNDAMSVVQYGSRFVELPQEVAATRADAPFWLQNMREHHGYSLEEAATVFGMPAKTLESRAKQIESSFVSWPEKGDAKNLRVMPYPGGRHPRIGFLDGAVSPQRGTKASIFSPWDASSYAVIDLPEAIFSNLGLMYLAHTHVQTIWEQKHIAIDNVDWQRHPDGSLSSEWTLPNGVSFGASIVPRTSSADLELWLKNGTSEPLGKLRTQICVMLKGMKDFNDQTNNNKRFDGSVAGAHSVDGKTWLLVAFEQCGRAWGNEKCPCLHSDPVLPDAAPGERVSVKGKVWFYRGGNVEREIRRAQKAFAMKDDTGRQGD
ncbi:MAG TPA: polysaccharide deacetylase family protein [Candidatus Hydrogenedentes bacterium]|nr:polysaccharide deacetylase family protein [Candidatus Hydrogenedentota bacterium]